VTQVIITQGGPALLDSIAPLWRKLTRHHAGISVHFSDEFHAMRWPARRADLLQKSREGGLHISLAKVPGKKRLLGYCVAVINKFGHGEIESLYVDDGFRGQGAGSALVNPIMAWFEKKKVKSTSVNVAVGNESAFEFYRHWGFYPRVTSLVRRKKKKDSPQRRKERKGD
jgi:ribosomal protein S18 acetylase RimI-like enzyme